jgi:hypothetical protein
MPQNAKFGTAAVLQVLFNDIDVDDIIGFTVTILQATTSVLNKTY